MVIARTKTKGSGIKSRQKPLIIPGWMLGCIDTGMYPLIFVREKVSLETGKGEETKTKASQQGVKEREGIVDMDLHIHFNAPNYNNNVLRNKNKQ